MQFIDRLKAARNLREDNGWWMGDERIAFEKDSKAKRIVVLHPGTVAKKNVEKNGVYYEHFAVDEPMVLIDLFNNVRCVQLSVSTSPYPVDDLPKIPSDDPQIRFIGAKKGQVVCQTNPTKYFLVS